MAGFACFLRESRMPCCLLALACALFAGVLSLLASCIGAPDSIAWAADSEGDSCGWAYLERNSDGKGSLKLTVQKEQRVDDGAYRELGAVSRDGAGGELPWDGEVGRITAVSVGKGVKPSSTANWFSGCKNLRSIDLSGLDMSNVNDATGMFEGCSSMKSLDLSGLDFSHVESMANLFAGCSSLRSIDLSGIDASAVTDLTRMFFGCSKLASLDLSGLDTSQVTDMSEMFSGCSSLVGLDLTGFKMASEEVDASGMFSGCKRLESIDLSWCSGGTFFSASYLFKNCRSLSKVSFPQSGQLKVLEMEGLFFGCRSLKSVDLRSIATSNPDGYESSASAFANSSIREVVIGRGFTAKEPLGSLFLLAAKWNAVGSSAKCSSPAAMIACVRKAGSAVMFRGSGDPEGVFAYGDVKGRKLVLCSGRRHLGSGQVAYGFASGGYIPWEPYRASIERVEIASPIAPKSVANWFNGCSRLVAIKGIGNLDTSRAASMESMFAGCKSLTTLDLSGFDTSRVTNMDCMFSECESLASLDLSGFDTSRAKSLSYLFFDCRSLASLDVSAFDTSRAIDLSSMFDGCSALVGLDVTSFDTSRSTGMSSMFGGCRSLASLDVSRFDVSRAENLQSMFAGCESLEYLDLSSFKITSADRTGKKSFEDDDAVIVTEMLDDCPALVSIRVSPMMVETPEFPAGAWKAEVDGDEYLYDQVPGGLDATWQRASWDTYSYARLTRDGELRISHKPLEAAEGDELYRVPDVGYGAAVDVPWHDRVGDVRSVIVGRGVSPRSTAFWFRGCTNLVSVNVSKLNTSKVEDFTEMFYCCTAIEELDLSGFDTRKAQSMRRMFHECRSLERVTLGRWFTFRGATWSRLPGSELPPGAWQQLGKDGEPVDALRAWASDSLPGFTKAAFAKVDEATSGLVVISVRGDADSDGGKGKLTEKYTIETTYTVKPDGTLAAENSYELDESYDREAPLIVGGAAKASSTKTLSSRTVSSITLNKVSGDVHKIYLGPQVVEVKEGAFAESPGVASIYVRSSKLATRSRIGFCMRGSRASVYIPREWSSVIAAFKAYAWPEKR